MPVVVLRVLCQTCPGSGTLIVLVAEGGSSSRYDAVVGVVRGGFKAEIRAEPPRKSLSCY